VKGREDAARILVVGPLGAPVLAVTQPAPKRLRMLEGEDANASNDKLEDGSNRRYDCEVLGLLMEALYGLVLSWAAQEVLIRVVLHGIIRPSESKSVKDLKGLPTSVVVDGCPHRAEVGKKHPDEHECCKF